MRLAALLDALPAELRTHETKSDADARALEIRGISYDSRRVEAGDLFFALRGANADGHRYLAQALDRAFPNA